MKEHDPSRHLPPPTGMITEVGLENFVDELEISGVTNIYKNKFRTDITSKDAHIEDLRKISMTLLTKIPGIKYA